MIWTNKAVAAKFHYLNVRWYSLIDSKTNHHGLPGLDSVMLEESSQPVQMLSHFSIKQIFSKKIHEGS
jgi:hypothetical protein